MNLLKTLNFKNLMKSTSSTKPMVKPILLLISFVVATFLSRFLNLPVNFSPILALALFAGAQWSFVGMGVLIPLGLMVASDMALGFHETMPYTYASVLLITGLGFLLRRQQSPLIPMVLSPLASSLLFFIVTNFGVWQASGLYSQNLKGFLLCYEMALPFFQNTVMSTIFFAIIFNGVWMVVRKKVTANVFSSNSSLKQI